MKGSHKLMQLMQLVHVAERTGFLEQHSNGRLRAGLSNTHIPRGSSFQNLAATVFL